MKKLNFIWWYQATIFIIGGLLVHAHAAEYLPGDKASYAPNDSVNLFVADSINQHDTTLELELDNQVIKYGGKVNVQGILKRTLIRFPKTGIDLEGKKITLKIFDPKGELVEQTTTFTDKQGNFQFSNRSDFTQQGAYTFIASFEDGETVYESKTYKVLVNELAGYAILIQGRKLKFDVPEDEAAYNKTLNRIYHHRLLKRGFVEDNIIYFNYNPEQPGVDEIPSKEKIQYHIEEWACDKISNVPAPLYLVILDHGIENQIFLGKEEISSTDLDQWLSQLETCLEERNPDALKEYQRVVIIGSCFSGSFIPTLSKKDKNRVIITSAQADEYAYKGRKELDSIRSGSFFLQALFHELAQGHSLRIAFKNASSTTIKYTKNRVHKQHPLLDDNGDGQGSSQLSYGGDGERIARLYLGVDDDNRALPAPVNKLKMTPALHLDYSKTAANLFVEVPNAREVSAVMIDIMTPSLRKEKINIKNGTSETGQKEIPSKSVFLQRVTKNRQENIGRFEVNYEEFTECGQYHLAHTVFYENGDISPYRGSTTTVYKCGGTLPDFDLKSPENNATTFTMTTFGWETPDNYTDIPITYTLLIAKDDNFQKIIYQQGEIQSTIAKVTGLEDFERYYWKVEAVNENGDSSTSATGFFNTDDPSALYKCLEVQVIDAIEKTSIPDVDFHFDPARIHTHYDQEDSAQGHYIRCADPAPTPYHIIMSALGYQPIRFDEWSSHSNEFNSGVEFSNIYNVDEKIIFELQPSPQSLPYLSVSLSDIPDPVAVGGTLYYTAKVELSASAPTAATDIQLTMQLPMGIELKSMKTDNSVCDVSQLLSITCNLTDLSVGDDLTVDIEVVLKDSGLLLLTHEAKVVTNEYPTHTDRVRTRVALYPDVKVDLVFVIDVTSSMQEEINGVIRALRQFIAEVDPSTTRNIALVTFRDEVTVEAFTVTGDLKMLLSTISKLTASGGNSCPEASAEALNLAIPHLKEGGILFLATDASPYPDVDLEKLTQRIKNKEIILYPMVTGDCSNKKDLND